MEAAVINDLEEIEVGSDVDSDFGDAEEAEVYGGERVEDAEEDVEELPSTDSNPIPSNAWVEHVWEELQMGPTTFQGRSDGAHTKEAFVQDMTEMVTEISEEAKTGAKYRSRIAECVVAQDFLWLLRYCGKEWLVNVVIR